MGVLGLAPVPIQFSRTVFDLELVNPPRDELSISCDALALTPAELDQRLNDRFCVATELRRDLRWLLRGCTALAYDLSLHHPHLALLYLGSVLSCCLSVCSFVGVGRDLRPAVAGCFL